MKELTDLLDINSSSEQVSGDENSGRTGSEFSHNLVSFVLVHITVLFLCKVYFSKLYGLSYH